MKSPALLILISLCLFSSGTRADAALKLHQLLDEHWARANQEQVFFRTDPDTYRPTERWLKSVPGAGSDGDSSTRRCSGNLLQ